MRRIRRWFADAPAPLVASAAATGFVLFQLAIRASLEGRPPSTESLLAVVTLGLLLAAVLAVVLVRRRRHRPTGPRWVDVSEAVDDVRLPEDADVEWWTGVLLRRRARAEADAGAGALVIGSAVLAGGLAWSLLGGPPFAWTVPTALLVAVVILRRVRQADIRSVDRILQPLLEAERECGTASAEGDLHPRDGTSAPD